MAEDKTAKYRIDAEAIKEYLYLNGDFSDIDEFCDFLLRNGHESNIISGLGMMLSQKIVQNKEEKEQIPKNHKEKIEWIRKHCILGTDTERSVASSMTEPEISSLNEAGQPSLSSGEPETDFEKVRLVFEETEYKRVKQCDGSELDYTADIVLHEGGIITQHQKNKVQLFNLAGFQLDTSKILIVEAEGNRVLALGYLIPEGQDYTVVFADKKCIDYSGFQEIRQARFIVYTEQGEIYSRAIELEYRPFEVEEERPLCIDFGTSNTTVGSYGILNRAEDKAEIVRFIDVTVQPNNVEAALLPTTVYVEDCSDRNQIKYLFGYEARKRIESEHYESKASVFYEIKRWISSAEQVEEIRDNHNNRALPRRKEIIKAYIDYVVEAAEQYFQTRFQKLHFSAPVKLKEEFIHVFSKLYQGEKQVLSAEDSIDEGIAIVYNQIITLLYTRGEDREETEEESKKKSIMIMDCGGGTTDFASCEYQYRKTIAGVELELDTCFENGNANFGGNNITYRIMQLLKIKIAAMLCKEKNEFEGEAIKLIHKSENEILGLIESHMKYNPYDSDKENSDIYADFLDNYRRAEQIIPTQYKDNQKYRGEESLKQVKRNFYYLWRQAEQIKIEFYRTERVLMDFRDTDEDAVIKIRNQENYYLYVADESNPNRLRRENNPFENISITIKEINRVICGDIYSLLVGLFQNGELTSKNRKESRKVDEYDYYKLSGQSCKISLFSELIKEYIPGRKFRPAIEKSGSIEKKDSEDLKLDCVLGSINYVRDQLRPEMNIISNSMDPEIIYNVCLKGTYGENKILFSCKEPDSIKMEISPVKTKEYPLMVTGKDGICEREFLFRLREPEANEGFYETDEIAKKLIGTGIVSEIGIERFIDELRDVARKSKETINIVFVVPAKRGYGMYIGQIQATSTEDGTDYRILKYEYESFEDASKTFFDGRR